MGNNTENRPGRSGALRNWTIKGASRLFESYNQMQSSMANMIEAEAETGDNQLRRMMSFYERTDLQAVSHLVEGVGVSDPHLPTLVLQRLAPYFEAGLLAQKLSSGGSERWLITCFCNRGECFNLDPADRIDVAAFIPNLSPLEMKQARGDKLRAHTGLHFLQIANDSDAYILKPTDSTALILFCGVPHLWREDHLDRTLKLVNQAFSH